jgi:glycerophosphoryl diester phosphodiesterase
LNRRATCHLFVVFARIGHGGASALAPANTLASFDAAREVGVDAIEFDVRAFRGELVLAHTILHARRGGNLGLRRALRHLAEPDFDGIEFHVDVKHTGFESALLDGLRDTGLLARTIVCSQVAAVLDCVRAREPGARVGISVGGRIARASQRWRDWRAQVLAGIQAGRWDALMAQHRLIDAGLLGDVSARSGLLYAWTVNQRRAIDALRALGVHGIATADPRLFAPSDLVNRGQEAGVGANQGRALLGDERAVEVAPFFDPAV